MQSVRTVCKMFSGVDGAEGNVGDILPFTSDAKSQSFANKFKQPSTFNDDNFKDFIAGDTRVEENPYLASFHTIFVRYHNLMVDGLRKQRPGKSSVMRTTIYANYAHGAGRGARFHAKIC